MRSLAELTGSERLRAIGIMSGTSADGVDAALVDIEGRGASVHCTPIASHFLPYSDEIRARLLALAAGESVPAREYCLMNRLLGEYFANACRELCAKAGVSETTIDLVGLHGHTFWHVPREEAYLGGTYAATWQMGDPSPVCERLRCVAVSDFRSRDMAAGGQGAPLVPYTDWLLYRDEKRNIALQNIGGIGNITFLPAGCELGQVSGFDTGPGNMVMDAIAAKIDPSLRYDPDGRIAAGGTPSEALLTRFLTDPYYDMRPPKTTGREKYGEAFVNEFWAAAMSMGITGADALATATMLTARLIGKACKQFSPFGVPDRLIVGGGGARNPTLLRDIQACLPETKLVRNEDLGWDGDAKEAIAFAILAAECVHGSPNNAPGATGARHPVIMGRISQ